MKNLTVKSLLAIGLMGAASAASAVQVYLVQNGHRAGSGTLYNAIANTGGATWDWTGGVLTQTGSLTSEWRIGSVPLGTTYFTDSVSGLVIDTNTASTTATSYSCVDGAFNSSIASSCGGFGAGLNGVLESTVNYNVGAMADCSTITPGGDDPVNSADVYRGLRSYDGNPSCGNHSGRGAFDMTQVVQNFGSDQYLILANWNSEDPINQTCIATKFSAINQAGNAGCLRAHWMTFQASPVPVPAAVWLFGSALGLLGVARRRRAA
ncbi:MAG: VPLPA-CTERM sorting domain-containing protein [Gammaproteobacteria bacterium]|nr:VPLPA-CTERM sorting domain-containing protein [Gammaproteobacteria bacterium]